MFMLCCLLCLESCAILELLAHQFCPASHSCCLSSSAAQGQLSPLQLYQLQGSLCCSAYPGTSRSREVYLWWPGWKPFLRDGVGQASCGQAARKSGWCLQPGLCYTKMQLLWTPQASCCRMQCRVVQVVEKCVCLCNWAQDFCCCSCRFL